MEDIQKNQIKMSKNTINNISLNFDDYHNNNYLTHNFHPYPAKFIPQIPKELILKLSKKGDWILDPFCGSGTTLVEANLSGRNSIGVDVNPISAVMSGAKTSKLQENEIKKILDILDEINNDLMNGKKYDSIEYKNINLWFKPDVKEALSIIRHHVLSSTNKKIKAFLSTAFSAIIVKVSNQESDTRYASIEKNISEKDVFYLIDKKVRSMLKRIREFNEVASDCKCDVYLADSTNLSFLKKNIDLIVTSPPYLNSYDYYLYHKHRIFWLGLDYKPAQDKEFGSRHQHSDLGKGLIDYEESMTKVIKECSKLLKKMGYFCVIIGDGILKGELIKMNRVMDKIFEKAGYKKVKEIVFNQRKYTRTFTPNLKTAYKDSYVIIYQH